MKKIVPLALLGSLAAAAVSAAPENGSIVSGQAVITQTGNRIDVLQQSSSLVINWSSFSIGAGETVQFRQPAASSTVLNRVIGGSLSSLNGQLLANGIVLIVNPAGIQVGSAGRVNVASFVATTNAIANADFLAGRYAFAAVPGSGTVGNAGVISVLPGGTVVLAATEVRNEGTIEAPRGAVALGAAKSFAVDLDGDGLLRYQVGEAVAGALVVNGGTITALGGHVLVSARSVDAVSRDVINVGGLIEANTVSAQGGEIVFDGGSQGIVTVAGHVRAVGDDSLETGGSIKVLGDIVAVAEGARIDASGAAGGGIILAGGGFQGGGPEHHASVAYVAEGATLAADATDAGTGGQVVVWSDLTTRFYGNTSVRGGPRGGDGGLAEVSSKGWLDFQGQADRAAPLGRAGLLLLDPLDLTIAQGANLGPTAMSGAGTSGGNPLQPSGGGSSINDGKINALLGGGSLYLSTGSGGNITMNNNVAINSGSANTLDIHSGGGFTSQVGSTVTLSGALRIVADNALNYGSTSTVSGNITLSGRDVSLSGSGITSSSGTIDVTSTASSVVSSATLSAPLGQVVIHNPSSSIGALPPPPPPSPPGAASAPASNGPGNRAGGSGPGDALAGGHPGAGIDGSGGVAESAFEPGPGEALGEQDGSGGPGAPPPSGPGGGPRRQPPSKPAVAQVIPGLLAREVASVPGDSQGVPGVSNRYSIFGNPALW
jgi:filamentous hemagglutinin family protein